MTFNPLTGLLAIAAVSGGHVALLTTLCALVVATSIANIVLRVVFCKKRKALALAADGETKADEETSESEVAAAEQAQSDNFSDEQSTAEANSASGDNSASEASQDNIPVEAEENSVEAAATDEEPDDEEEADDTAESEDEDDEEDDAEDEDENEDDGEDGENSAMAGIAAGAVLSGEAGDSVEVAGRRFGRYNYSFRAKLIQASDEMKARYASVADEILSFKKVKTTESWKKVRVHKGRKTLAIMTFRGKTLSVALALDPKEYEGTKYRGKDVSDKKSYAATPMLIKLSSDRKAKYVRELFEKICDEQGYKKALLPEKTPAIPFEEKEALIEKNLIKDNMGKETIA